MSSTVVIVATRVADTDTLYRSVDCVDPTLELEIGAQVIEVASGSTNSRSCNKVVISAVQVHNA